MRANTTRISTVQLDVRAVIGTLDVDPAAVLREFARDRPGRLRPFGPSGFALSLHASSGVACGSIIVTQAEHDGAGWIHASLARANHMPSYDDLARLKRAVFGPDRYAFQVFPPASRHVNIHAKALHLWGRADSVNPLPDFGAAGTI